MPICFVIMPITTPPDLVPAYDGDADHFAHVLSELHAPALRQAGYDIVPPMVDHSAVIQSEIINGLATADLVLCDMSALNPNVFFELGIRVALDRPVAMIKDDLTKIPFDTSVIGCHTYKWQMASWSVRDEIPKLARFVRRTGAQERNALWRVFGPAERRPTSGRADPTPVGSAPAVGDFDVCVDRLLEAGGLTTRRWTYTLSTDRARRLVRLAFLDGPPEFLEDVLRKEAARLALHLDLSRRPTR